MDETPRRPFWKRKRWIAAAVLWLMLSYVLSVGPVEWLYARKLVSPQLHPYVFKFYSPLHWLMLDDRYQPQPWARRCGWVWWIDTCRGEPMFDSR